MLDDRPLATPRSGAGATIGEIRILNQDIFDLQDSNENKRSFRWANALHIQTHPGVIDRALLFKSGDALSVRLIDETERVLRSTRYLYDVRIWPLAVHDGVVDIEVATRDTSTLELGVSAGRAAAIRAESTSRNTTSRRGRRILRRQPRLGRRQRERHRFGIAEQRRRGLAHLQRARRLYIEVALPLNSYAGLKKVQFLVKTKASF